MVTAILGGAFNPPHNGHLALARTVLDLRLADTILFVPTGLSPHKLMAGGASTDDRLAMTRMLADTDPDFDITDIELRRVGPSYTIDTVRALAVEAPAVQWRLIIGSDMAAIFTQWRSWRELLFMAPPLIAQRPDFVFDPDPLKRYPGMDEAERNVMDKGRFPMPFVHVNSTLVRGRLLDGLPDRDLEGLVPAPVLEYIRRNNLYVKESEQ